MQRETEDRYTPPPRHKERSGAFVRFAIVAALLGAAGWGYLEFSKQPQTALVAPRAEEERSVAENGYAPAPAAREAAPAEANPTTPEPGSAQPPA